MKDRRTVQTALKRAILGVNYGHYGTSCVMIEGVNVVQGNNPDKDRFEMSGQLQWIIPQFFVIIKRRGY